MAVFYVATDALETLADALAEAVAGMGPHVTEAAALLDAHGFGSHGIPLRADAAATTAWGEAWATSLRARLDLLRTQETIAVGPSGLIMSIYGADLTQWTALDARRQLFGGVPLSAGGASRAAAAPLAAAGTGPPGERLADALLDALEAGDLDEVTAVLARLIDLLTDPVTLADFFVGMGPDMTGLFPQLVIDLGAAPDELPELMAPMAQAVAVAAAAGTLPFTGAELLAGHEGRSTTPAIFLDFAGLPLWFLQETAPRILSAFAADELPMHGPDYPIADGTSAGPDPRLALLRAVARLDVAAQRSFVAGLADAGLLDALVAPATPWGDNGTLAGSLLTAVGTDPATSAVMADVLRTAFDATPALAPGVEVGIAAGLVPHLGSLVASTHFGPGHVDLPGTPLRDALGDGEGALVQAVLTHLMANDTAREIVVTAVGVLIAATLADHLDPADSRSLAGVTDDLGALWGLVLDARLGADLSAAETTDATNRVTQIAFNSAIGATTAGASQLAAALGFETWAGGVVLDAVETGVPLVRSLTGGPRQTERVLRNGYAAQQAAADFVVFALAAALHDAGALELPEGLLADGSLVAPRDEAAWQQLLAAVEAAGIDPEEWFGHAYAIAGYAIPTP